MNPEHKNYDVYFARGNGVEKKPGNIQYRKLIAHFHQSYKAPGSNNNDKNNIANTIISAIISLGGTFYHQQKGSEDFVVWEELELNAIEKKVKQSLRDSKPPPVSSSIQQLPTPPLLLE